MNERIRIPEPWFNLIQYCVNKFPNGELRIRIANGCPTKLLDQKPDIRFDKAETLPKIIEDFE